MTDMYRTWLIDEQGDTAQVQLAAGARLIWLPNADVVSNKEQLSANFGDMVPGKFYTAPQLRCYDQVGPGSFGA